MACWTQAQLLRTHAQLLRTHAQLLRTPARMKHPVFVHDYSVQQVQTSGTNTTSVAEYFVLS